MANTMKTLRFGIEIETIGQTRNKVAKAIQSIVGGTIEHVGQPYCYDPYHVTAADGRIWKVMADSSLSASKSRQAEIVSPILEYRDIETLQNIIRAVRKTQAKFDKSCGIHIHLDGARFNTKALCNLTKIVNKQEELIIQALGVKPDRQRRFCRSVPQELIENIDSGRVRTNQQLNSAWYGFYNHQPTHYHSSRYHGLNLHNIWYRGTVELRYFEATLHAGEVKSYIQFALALGAKAITARSAKSERRAYNPQSAKYDVRVFLLSLGLIGKEFKTCRLHLLKRLSGSSAWKNGQPSPAGQQQVA